MSENKFQFVRLDISVQGLATLTLARTDKHNAFNEHVIAEITTAVEIVRKEAALLVLQADGKSFSAGADLDWMRRMAEFDFEQNMQDANGLAQMLNALYTLPIPTIAKVQGSAYGGGVGLVACCDLVVASDNAKFCLSEVKLGLIPATISPYVVEAVGAKTAKRLFITAELFSAVQAQGWGLVTKVVTTDQLDEEIDTLVTVLTGNSPAAIAASKQLVDEVSGKTIDEEILTLTSKRIAEARVSRQGREGVAAFLDKRKPSWT